MPAPHVRKERFENGRKPGQNLRVNELDPDEGRGGETGNDRSDLLQATRTADVQEPGVSEEDVRALPEFLKQLRRRNDFAMGEQVISNAVIARIQRVPVEVPPVKDFVVAEVVDDLVHDL